MLREYEFTVIAKGDLPEAESTELAKKYEDLMVKGGGEILRKDDWGTRKIAFPINKQHRGHYTFYDFAGQSENITEIERLMRIDENILRYMSVKIADKIDVAKRKAELAKGNDDSRKQERDAERDQKPTRS